MNEWMNLPELWATIYSSISKIWLGQSLEVHRENIKRKFFDIFLEWLWELKSPINPETLWKIDVFFYEFKILLDIDSELVRVTGLLPWWFKRELLEMYPDHLLEHMWITIPSEEELQAQIEDLNKKSELQVQRLLDESDILSHELWYDILAFVILVTWEIHGVGELIKENDREIGRLVFISPSDVSTNFDLAECRAREKTRQWFIEWKQLLDQWRVIKWLALLEKELIQGNMHAAFEIGKYYEFIDHPEAQRYLNIAYISWVWNAMIHIGKKRAEDSEDILGKHDFRSMLELGSYQFGSLDCFRAYMNEFSDRREKKGALKQLIQEDRIVDPDWMFFTEYTKRLQSNKWSMRLSDCNTRIRLKYKKYASEFCKRLKKTFGIEYDPDLITQSLSFSFMDDWFSDPAGDYNIESGSIRIDYFFHVDWALIENPETFRNFFGTFCHEAIHKVSIESSENRLREIPRFINEWLTATVEGIISWYPPKSYETERKIVKKLIELSGKEEMEIFRQFMRWKFSYIADIFNPHINEILDIFSEDKDFNGENDFSLQIMWSSQWSQTLLEEVIAHRDLVQWFQIFWLRISATEEDMKTAYHTLVRENQLDRWWDENKMAEIHIAKEEICKLKWWS